jgi:tryptophan synthase alpha chain
MSKLFKNLKRPALSIFTTAGFPKIDSLNDQLNELEKQGVDFVEVGIPFSDPLADGPVIQASSMVALENGMNLSLLFKQLEQRTATIPLILMGYINPILSYGLDEFLNRAKKCNISGFVLPDLSIEIYEKRYKSTFEQYGIPLCFLVTPATHDERIKKSAALSKDGFLYLVSSNQTTGSGNSPTEDLSSRYQHIQKIAHPTPVVIGFGIKNKADFQKATAGLDGGIIGSAFIQAVEKGEEKVFLEGLKPITHQ